MRGGGGGFNDNWPRRAISGMESRVDLGDDRWVNRCDSFFLFLEKELEDLI